MPTYRIHTIETRTEMRYTDIEAESEDLAVEQTESEDWREYETEHSSGDTSIDWIEVIK